MKPLIFAEIEIDELKQLAIDLLANNCNLDAYVQLLESVLFEIEKSKQRNDLPLEFVLTPAEKEEWLFAENVAKNAMLSLESEI